MFDGIGHWLLRVLRVPPQPEPPVGAPESVRVFRAGRNYYRLRFYLWVGKQVLALAGFAFSLFLITQIERAGHPAGERLPDGTDSRQHWRQPQNVGEAFGQISDRTPARVFVLLWVLKGIALVVYLVQLPITYALLRLDYEQRWYMVTDRSLRLRSGIGRLREMTMSFANLQQITVAQGPLQRLLGLADVKVQSAGGGGATQGHYQHGHESLHTGLFHAVENAEEIRDLITERLRRFRETGLGDPDEKRHHPFAPPPLPAHPMESPSALAAANELLTEAKALRQALG